MKPLLTFSLFLVSWNFVLSQNYFLNGNAIATGNDCYQLTDALNYQNGTVWYANQIDLNQSFDITFEMNVGDNDGGADGICFVMHTQGTSAIGQSGGGLGYLNFGTSLAVEFDTWQNGEYGDPSFDHIAIVQNGDINHNGANNLAGPVQMDAFNANTEDGQTRTVRITWNPTTQLFQVYYNCVFRVQTTVDIINTIFNGQSNVYWGFTAATGGAENVQTVCLTPNILNVGNEVLICEGGSTILSVGAALNNTYVWTPTTYLSDPTSASPVATPPSSTTYTVMYTDLCGIDVAQTIDVLVEPLTVNLNTPTVLTCNAPTASISSFSNFPGVVYSWTGPSISTATNASSIQLNAPGWYVLETNVNSQCFDVDSVLVISNQIPPELTLLESASTLNCTVLTSEITAESNLSSNNFNWSGLNIAEINGSSIVVDGPGIYNCLVTDPNNGCTSSASVTINQNTQSPVLTGLTTDTLTCEIPTIALDAWEDLNVLNETNYTWYTSNWNLFSTEIYPQVNTSDTYNLIAYNSSNTCADTLAVNVVTDASNQFDINTIQFANIVTLENADGINDCWNIFHDQLLPEELSILLAVRKIFIFNRWGDQLFELNNQFSICEELKDLTKGTYYFIVEIETICGSTQNLNKEGFFLIK
ncbi:MAG: hypothetical protein FJX90_06290 [Bacteroidetes bacterium]|nr:hypothetical protein [Bacteroidota bacterium]